MSAERKKLLWISISACVFVLLVLAVGFFLLTPKKGGALAPATIGNSAPPKAQDPQDYLSAPPAPSIEQPRNQDGGVTIIYGDKPKPSEPAQASQAQGAAGAASSPAASPEAAAAPAPQAPAAAKPAAAAKSPAASKPAAASAAASAKPATVKVEEYWIQAASFASRGRADELKQSLAEKGVASLISVKDISGKSYYRVRVGPYSVKAEAADWLSRIKPLPGCAEAYVSATVVQKPKK
jgi:DedD protein